MYPEGYFADVNPCIWTGHIHIHCIIRVGLQNNMAADEDPADENASSGSIGSGSGSGCFGVSSFLLVACWYSRIAEGVKSLR